MALSPRVSLVKAIVGLTADASQINGNTQAQATLEPVLALQRKVHTFGVTDAGTAGNAVGEREVFYAERACTVKAVRYGSGIAVTADNTTYATITLQKRPASAVGTPVSVAENTTKITDTVMGANLVAFTNYTMTLTSTLADLNMVAGDILTIKVAKASTGVALGAAVTASGQSAQISIELEET